MGDTSIEWTGKTWNPRFRGCTHISPGCTNCYAARIAGRFSGPGKPWEGLVRMTKKGARWNGKVELIEGGNIHLHDPLAWRKPTKVFVSSMSDLFHEKLSGKDIAPIYGVMACASQHTFQVLTKRPHQMDDFYRSVRANPAAIIDHAYRELDRAGQHVWSAVVAARFQRHGDDGYAYSDVPWPLPNVWVGVSVENQEHGVPRIDVLRQIPAAVRFLSIEPLLEDLGELDLTGIHWVIIGCESGPGARPCELEWVRNIIRQCRDQRVAVFVKQLMHERKVISLPVVDGVQYANFPEPQPYVA